MGIGFEGVRVPLIGPQGILKPAILAEMPLSIDTVPAVEKRPQPSEYGLWCASVTLDNALREGRTSAVAACADGPQAGF